MILRPGTILAAMQLGLVASIISAAPNEPPVKAPNPPAKAGVLDLIPHDAAVAFAIRNMSDLRLKGDKFIEETEMRASFRPSQIFAFLLQWIGVHNGLDDKAPIALVMVNLKKVGIDGAQPNNLERALVLAIPFTNRGTIARNFNLTAGDLEPGKIVKANVKKQQTFDLRGYVAVRGRHLLMSSNDKAIRAVLEAPSIRKSLGTQQQKTLDRADMLLHVGTKGWGKDWDNLLATVRNGIDPNDDSPEARLVRELGEAVRGLEFGLVGVRLDGGIGLNVLTLFDDTGTAQRVLTRLAGRPGASDLKGLPTGKVMAAQATRTDGQQTVVIARALLELVLKNFAETKQLVSVTDRPSFVGVFGEVWQQLQGSRMAVYQNSDERKQGLMSIVALLDTEDPAEFLAEMRELTTFISNRGLKLTDGKPGGIDKKKIAELIFDLGDSSFRVRRTATVKLGLLGEPALPFLEQATKSTDLEVATRAKRLRKQITTAAAARRKDLLGRDLLSKLRPKFAYFPKAETRGATSIDVINIRLSATQTGYRRQMRELLGPDWAKIRVATHRGQVIVLFGSDTSLLEQAIKNVKGGAAGLAETASLREFRRSSDGAHKVELHLSLSRTQRLITPTSKPPANAAKVTDDLSSVALTIAPRRIQLDVFIPFTEAKVILKGKGW